MASLLAQSPVVSIRRCTAIRNGVLLGNSSLLKRHAAGGCGGVTSAPSRIYRVI